MNRYTTYDGTKAVIPVKAEWDNETVKNYLQSAFIRFAKYEDTGLTPEQIVEMKNKVGI